MKTNSRSVLILTILFGYILLQFLWWEVLLVRQSNNMMNEKQKLMELSISNELQLKAEVDALHSHQKTQTIMIVCEGTVFLLLLLFGMYKIKKSIDKEAEIKQQQQNFFLSITHELKTPISATKLQLQTLLKQKLDLTTQQDIIQSALVENDRLNLLIDNVLLASRIESVDYSFNLNRENLSELLTTVLNRYYKNLIQNNQLQLHISSNVYCQLDVQNFTSVITNLIDNAIKYSDSDRKIEVYLEKENQAIRLKFIDNGFGIKGEDKLKVFERFYRVGSEETRQTKGTGLGLYIVQNIVQKHQGRIILYENQPKGSIFEIQLNGV